MKGFVGVIQEEIPISSSHFSGILVAGHAKRGAGICKEMRLMSKVRAEYSSAWRSSQPPF